MVVNPHGIMHSDWATVEEGYRWVQLPSGALFLTSGLPTNMETLQRYHPLEDERTSALFREFADLPITEEAIQGFASKYGLLGGVTQLKEYEGETVAGDLFYHWAKEIDAMQKAIQVWEHMGDPWDLLVPRNHPKDEDHFFVHHKEDQWEELEYVTDIDLRRFTAPNTKVLAKQIASVYVVNAINFRLEKHTSASLALGSTNPVPRLELRPKSLLGALWLQFARAVDAEKEYRRCQEPGCGKWYEIDHSRHRSTKSYCSDGCRQKAYRRKKAEAKQLHAEGISVEEIAARLESEVKTVQKWVK